MMVKTRFEKKLIDQGFADTRARRLDTALKDLHGAPNCPASGPKKPEKKD